MGIVVITRKKGEDIDIETPSGEKVIIRIIRIKGKQIRVGVMARRDVEVDRPDKPRTIEDDVEFFKEVNES